MMEPEEVFLAEDADGIGGDLDRIMVARGEQWEREGSAPPWWDDDASDPLPEWETMPYDEPTAAEIHEILDEVSVAPVPRRCEQCHLFGAYSHTKRAFTCCCQSCGGAPMVPMEFEMCAPCMHDKLCRICGVKLKVAHGRCDSCRKYFDRTGRERPREMGSKKQITAADLEDRYEQRLRDHDEWDRNVRDAWLR